MTAWDHRNWWASLTEQQRREHNLKSALGTFKASLSDIEDLYRCHQLSANVTIKLTDGLQESLLGMERAAAHFSLHLYADGRATRERVAHLRLRARSDPKVVLS